MSKKRFSPIHIFLPSLALALAACAAHPPAARGPLPGKDACFWSSSLQDWTVLDDSTLIVHAPLAKDAYLIKLFAPIFGLSFHETLGFETGGGSPGQICGQTSYVLARNTGGGIPDRQPIIAVRALTPAEAKTLLSAKGASAPHQQAAKPPTPPAS